LEKVGAGVPGFLLHTCRYSVAYRITCTSDHYDITRSNSRPIALQYYTCKKTAIARTALSGFHQNACFSIIRQMTALRYDANRGMKQTARSQSQEVCLIRKVVV